MNALASPLRMVRHLQTREVSGRLTGVRGLTVTTRAMHLPTGGQVRIEPPIARGGPVLGEVIASDQTQTTIMLYGSSAGLAPGDRVVALQPMQTVPLSLGMLGRVLDGLGRPIDGKGALPDTVSCPLEARPVSSMQREPITRPLETGIRAIDAMVTIGRGQRLGIFSGPGVGKSTLLATIARNSSADVKVIAMIGERGREVREFLDNTLGHQGLEHSVVFVATGDESPLMRVRAAMSACAAAELYRDHGLDVVFLMDSVTRFCQAQRQIGLTAGEPPTTRGYTPSVFASLPGLLERAGRLSGGGSITGLYAILVEGDDLTEPISDAVRGILDGHLVLSRRLANLGHYPAIDVLDSVSRTAPAVTTPNHQQARRMLSRLLARYSEIEEVISVGAYVRGADAENDVAVEFKPRIDEFLRQAPNESSPYEETEKQLISIAVQAGHALSTRAKAAAANNGPPPPAQPGPADNDPTRR